MQRVLFHTTIFGPIHSRRLGVSLGINLTPNDGKICTFDCLYCEAGFNAQGPGTTGFAPRKEVARLLREKLSAMRGAGEPLDVITFSGNGEPTLHPDFPEIIDDTLRLRDEYYPSAKVSVLSNSTRIFTPAVAEALDRVDNNILKLDSAITTTMRALDRPTLPHLTSEKIIEGLRAFSGRCIIQTLLVRGEYEGRVIDNTTPEEIEALIRAYAKIGPREVMLYSIDRKTPAEHLAKVSREELDKIATQITSATGIKVETV
ncbi:MAG: radical SAM protein [Muribaculaceae bacterium]|nr:radical SAM protein [Muribaculaceae bacterium]